MSGKDLAKGVQGRVDIRKHANLLVVAVQEWRFAELFRSVCKETVGSTLPKLTCRIDANLNPRTYDCRVHELEAWAQANKRDASRDVWAFWALKIPAILASASAGVWAHFGLTTVSVVF